MSNKKAFWFFVVATLLSAGLFIYLTVDTHRQVKHLTHEDNLTDEVIAGKKVWEKYNCNDCHTILGFGGYYAPDMTKAYKRLGGEGIAAIVKNPDQIFASSWRKMPNQNVSDAEIANLTSFLKWISEINNNDWPPQDSDRAKAKEALKLLSNK
ncbi:MAG: c-type cytochrome [Deltaproteobacteria bacterium]|nr:c-type cytochrome [Deltaproteobacteria bacterium]